MASNEDIRRYNKEYKERHRERLKITAKKYNKEHFKEIKIKKKIYNSKNRDKIKIRERKYRKKNRKEIKLYQKKYLENYDLPDCSKYGNKKVSARQNNKNFNLSFEEFLLFKDRKCIYCGKQMKGFNIDRFDNRYGYFLFNCVPCCQSCNRRKKQKTPLNFICNNEDIQNHLSRRVLCS